MYLSSCKVSNHRFNSCTVSLFGSLWLIIIIIFGFDTGKGGRFQNRVQDNIHFRGEIDEFLRLDGKTSLKKKSSLYVRRVKHLDRVIPANPYKAANNNARCAVFSCASPGYFLTEASLKENIVSECDRFHFATNAYSKEGKKVASTWCRVPIFQQLNYYFRNYERVLYVDPDVRYRESMIMKSDCNSSSSRPGAMIISTKTKNGVREMQMNWLLICNVKDDRLKSVFNMWDEAYKNVWMQDQTVFNEVWKCGDLDGGIKCVRNDLDCAILVFHCGGYLTRFLRPKCMRKQF